MTFNKNKSFQTMLKAVMDKNYTANSTLISIDLKNGVIIDGFKKLVDFSEEIINVTAADKNIYIHGEMLQLTSFSKSAVYISGKITKIEIFEVK